jgi:hypothetical protein
MRCQAAASAPAARGGTIKPVSPTRQGTPQHIASAERVVPADPGAGQDKVGFGCAFRQHPRRAHEVAVVFH